MNQQTSKTLRAYAKINLGLQIIRKRVDGYHDIETVFRLVNIYDEIMFKPEDSDIIVDGSHPEIPLNQFNLCWRAADILRQHIGREVGVRIIFQKNIPIGAGLGGGSANAALVLRELPKFWNVHISGEALFSMALSLGSDVPYFLIQGTALATARGEILEYFDLKMPYWIVLVYPGVRISTAWAYQNVQLEKSQMHENLKRLLMENIHNPQVLVNRLRNDFEPLVFRHHEEVLLVKETLYRFGAALALMSGSGSAVYGLFESEQSAKRAVDSFRMKYPVFLTEPGFKPPR